MTSSQSIKKSALARHIARKKRDGYLRGRVLAEANPVLALPPFIPLGHLVDTSKNISEQGPSTSLPDALEKERKEESRFQACRRNQ